jgi:hypothetical protein
MSEPEHECDDEFCEQCASQVITATVGITLPRPGAGDMTRG